MTISITELERDIIVSVQKLNVSLTKERLLGVVQLARRISSRLGSGGLLRFQRKGHQLSMENGFT